ncbi:phosphoethanolamine transferase [Amphritea sp. HPY]|uniref:phosphoethanolamine transferase n=1 Tax=Amphritea sp. HPY TaxID=3421652 RepID=UPI003D7DAB2E
MSNLAERARRFPKISYLLIIAAIVVLDLLLVRDLSWFLENFAGKRFWVNLGFSTLAMLLLLPLVVGTQNRLVQWLVIGLILVPQLVQLSYFSVYRNFVTVFDLRFFAEDPWLSFELWFDNAVVFKPLLLIVLELPLLLLIFKLQLKPRWWWQTGNGVLGTLLFLLITFNWYGAAKFQLSSVAYIGVFPSLIERQAFADTLAAKPVIEARKAAADAPNIVFVVGESLTRRNLGVYGYDRDTTPNLQRLADQQQLVVYNNAVSIGTRTLSSVPYMLTGLQGIDPLGQIYSTPTIFNYARAAGYQTGFITAQDFQWRNIDQIFVDQDMGYYRNGTDFSAEVSVSIGADDMKVLNRGVKPYLDQLDAAKPFMLVVQMNGSHYPYDEHSPAEVKKFLPETDPNGLNAYDNTVLYTDLYLSELVKAVRAKDPQAWVFYSTDHGQDVSADETFFNRGYSSGTIHNAMMVFPPPQMYELLQRNQDSPVSQADIFATILALMDIEPVVDIDGVDLQQEISTERLRVVSAYMKTLHNEPNAVLVFPDMRYIHVDFERGSATLRDGKTLTKYEALPAEYREVFERRMQSQPSIQASALDKEK